MEITIREANESDFEVVSAVFRDELSFHTGLLPDRFQLVEPVISREHFNEIVQNSDKEIIVAILESDMVGALQIEMRSTPDLPFFVRHRFAKVIDLSVRRELRFRGYGRSLMRSAAAWAEERGATALELSVWELNKDAISFYERIGFTTIRRRMSYIFPPDQ